MSLAGPTPRHTATISVKNENKIRYMSQTVLFQKLVDRSIVRALLGGVVVDL